MRPTVRAAVPAATKAPAGELRAAAAAALAAEHAAIYGYGVAGAQLTGAAQLRARTDVDSHRAQRDDLATLIRALGDHPVAAAPAYDLPFAVSGPQDAIRLIVRLEDGVAAAYADLVAASTGALRARAARDLQHAAVRATRWRRRPVPFPGLPEAGASGTPVRPGDSGARGSNDKTS
jgi:hypothetical protein